VLGRQGRAARAALGRSGGGRARRPPPHRPPPPPHDSDLINGGLAADAGYVGTFRHEAERDLDELRATFRRKAHTAAMERCLTGVLRASPDRPVESLGAVVLGDLPDGPHKDALLRRRTDVGLSTDPAEAVLVDHTGRGYPPDDVPLALRRARSTRISIDGNAHFCRGLLRTRYADEDVHQAPRPDGAEPADRAHDPAFIPLAVLTGPTHVTEEHR
jgi:hypothetical protein